MSLAKSRRKRSFWPLAGLRANRPDTPEIVGARDPDTKENLRVRLRILAWAILISLICGAIEFGAPLEDLIRAGRDTIRSQPADQKIVVVAVDDKTIADLGGLSFPRKLHGEVVDNLFAMGAKRIFYDKAFADPSTPSDDWALAEALRRHRGKVWLGTLQPKLRNGRGQAEIGPLKVFAKEAQIASLNGRVTAFDLSALLPFQRSIGGGMIPSMSAALANRHSDDSSLYRPDWSIQIRSIPTYSFSDALYKKIDPSLVRGKDVVIGSTYSSSMDFHRVISQGWLPGVYIHVVGAQTLKRAMPSDWGWLAGWLVGLILSIVQLFSYRKITRKIVIITGLVIFGAIPLFLDTKLILVQIVPGALLLTIVGYRAAMLRRLRASSETNLVSGLPHLAVLRNADLLRPETLIALKLRNYAEIAASFDEAIERNVIQEISRRIKINSGVREIYHGEDLLLWMTPMLVGEELGDHIRGLRALLTTPFKIGSRIIDLSVSFGVDADYGRPMVSRVGSAAMTAEEAAANDEIWRLYDPQRQHEASWQLSLLSSLDDALDAGEIWVAYQPQIDLPTGRISGAEALVRWHHPERGLVAPDTFIPAAERHNRIDRLTWFVLDQAVAAAASLVSLGHDFSISVNLSVQLLKLPVLPDIIAGTLARHHLPAHHLVLEITETGTLDRNGSSLAAISKIANSGVRISIDDYGTGNATLDYLKIVPAHEIKIDRGFVKNVVANEDDRVLVASTIAMAHSLGRSVVAEGVESRDVLNVLAAMGCDSAQGFAIGKPSNFETLAGQLAEDRRAAQRRAR